MERMEHTLRILLMGFMVSVIGCGGDKDGPAAPMVSQT